MFKMARLEKRLPPPFVPANKLDLNELTVGSEMTLCVSELDNQQKEKYTKDVKNRIVHEKGLLSVSKLSSYGREIYVTIIGQEIRRTI